jgi:broad specificity phosphatase PhoE
MCDPVGLSIPGRSPGIHLNDTGRRQAERLAERLRGVALAGIYSSPLERALETAAPVAREQELEVRTLNGFNEVDFGEWTAKGLAELDQLSAWRTFNSYRSGTRIPGGENMAEVLSRVLRDLDHVRASNPADAVVAVVSHGDVLRVLITHALGLSFDFMQRIELSPASISILSAEDHGSRLLRLNDTDGWPSGIPLRNAP